jgi:hypothetical protein
VGDGVTASVGVRDRLAVAVAGTGVAGVTPGVGVLGASVGVLDKAVGVAFTPGVLVEGADGMLAVGVAVGCG